MRRFGGWLGAQKMEAMKGKGKIPKGKMAKTGPAKEDDLEKGAGELVGKKMRIIDDGHAFCGRCFVCEASSAEYAKGHVGKDASGYWKDDKRVGNVFVKISAVQIVEEDEREPAKWKKMQLSNAQKTEVALKFGWPSAEITAEDVHLDGNTNMLSIVHLEMCEWMSRRDLDAPVRDINQKMAFFRTIGGRQCFRRGQPHER